MFLIYQRQRTNMTAITNPFERYYGNEGKNKYASRSPTLLNDYITLITGMFEQKCVELEERMNSIARSKYTKRRHDVYSRLNELEDLRSVAAAADSDAGASSIEPLGAARRQ